jgi:hypothetical protein
MCCFVRLGFFCLCGGGEKKQNKLPSICTDLFTKHQINKFFFLLINLLFQSIEFCLFTLAYNGLHIGAVAATINFLREKNLQTCPSLSAGILPPFCQYAG